MDNIVEQICADFYAKGFSVRDNFISPADASVLLKEIKDRGKNLKKAGIGSGAGKQIRAEVRGDFIQWIEKEDVVFQQNYLDKLEPVIEAFNKKFFLGINQSEHHLALYPTGTRYEKHVDTFKNTDARVVSSVLYLNPNWLKTHGGELIIYPENSDSVRVEPLSGRLVLFESTLPHEVLESQAPRYSITGWFKRNSVF